MSDTHVTLSEAFTLPDYCEACGAYLMGSWTVHTDECPIGRLIREFKESLQRGPNAETPPER